jgi:hypothetical protein
MGEFISQKYLHCCYWRPSSIEKNDDDDEEEEEEEERRVEGKTMYLSWEFYDNFRANEAGNLSYYLCKYGKYSRKTARISGYFKPIGMKPQLRTTGKKGKR